MSRSYVVTGGGRGVGRAIAARLAADGGTVVIIETDEAALDWVPGHPAAARLSWVTGSAADERVAEAAAERAEMAAPWPAGSTTPRCSVMPRCTPPPRPRSWT
jgi:NAD(P)-dependent dehydrogenase (short-subunit alcohol dehydrogenase family)